MNEAIFRFDLFVKRATTVGHPSVVHVVITAWRDPVNLTFSTPYLSIRTDTAFRTNTVCALEEPYAHFEAEISASQSANWTDVYRVERVIVRKLFSREAGQGGVGAAIDKAKHIVTRDFLTETDAA